MQQNKQTEEAFFRAENLCSFKEQTVYLKISVIKRYS